MRRSDLAWRAQNVGQIPLSLAGWLASSAPNSPIKVGANEQT